jgi:hypothetical protein
MTGTTELVLTCPREVSLDLIDQRLARPAIRADRVDVDLVTAIVVGAVSAGTTVVVTEVTKAAVKGVVAAIRKWLGASKTGAKVTVTLVAPSRRIEIDLSAESPESFVELEQLALEAFTTAALQASTALTEEPTDGP